MQGVADGLRITNGHWYAEIIGKGTGIHFYCARFIDDYRIPFKVRIAIPRPKVLLERASENNVFKSLEGCHISDRIIAQHLNHLISLHVCIIEDPKIPQYP